MGVAAVLLFNIQHQGVEPDQITVHADRGSAPTSKTLKQMMIDLVQHSRWCRSARQQSPYPIKKFTVSSTITRASAATDARSFCRRTFDWYNYEHHHSGLAMLTPAQVHYRHAEEVLAQRQRVLDAAYAARPERFVNGPPTVPSLPQAVWINPPRTRAERDQTSLN